jgi:hypothetical protein
VASPGLPQGDNVVYAEIGWKALAQGTTDVTVAVSGEDPLFDGSIPPFGADVSGDYTFVPTTLVIGVPEPATLAMAGMSLIGLAFRRRNG